MRTWIRHAVLGSVLASLFAVPAFAYTRAPAVQAPSAGVPCCCPGCPLCPR